METEKTDKEKLFEALRKLAVFKGVEVTQERIGLYVEYLSRYDLKKVSAALKVLLNTHTGFPDIAHIVKLVDPSMTEDEKGNEIAGAIIDSVKSFGSYQPLEAKKYLGPIAWWVVESFGGWGILCRMTTAELGTTRAQLREMGKAARKVASRNLEDPKLLKHEKEGTKRIGELLKNHEEKLLT